ncbi:MAG: aminoglycoside phosphotransferase family protein [Treponema sp.]|jgi:Ser/Thr protein kinase RdoA (MazF antagonist)|nr:aminoglycoside phosphotransferase family protein [Treponema sp.]
MEKDQKLIQEAALQFVIYGDFEKAVPYGKGHINDTFASQWNQAGLTVRYLHQRINHKIFVRPDQVMENIQRVTNHIAAKLEGLHDRSRRTLTLVPARNGGSWVRDSAGGWWRTYLFIEGTHTLDIASSPEEARFLGKSIGCFQNQLADLPQPRLHETIPNFHNMETRYQRFHQALKADICHRAKDAEEEIAFMLANEERGALLIKALKSGALPERICHNDTKMNNILIDDQPSKMEDPVFCVGDLDTVMPGTSLFDVGDLIRTVCTRAVEDEQDLAKVSFDPVFFQALLEGYLSEAKKFLTSEEKRLLLEGGRNITQIMGLRFLTDYLEGDHYYHISRDRHNLDRCRNQITLIRSIDAEWEKAEQIVSLLLA